MNDETITEEARDGMRGHALGEHCKYVLYRHDVPLLLDALAAAEKRATDAEWRLAQARFDADVYKASFERVSREMEATVRERDAALEEASKERVRFELVMGALANVEHPNVRAAVMKAIGEVRGV